jgi:hypothetical protein
LEKRRVVGKLVAIVDLNLVISVLNAEKQLAVENGGRNVHSSAKWNVFSWSSIFEL